LEQDLSTERTKAREKVRDPGKTDRSKSLEVDDRRVELLDNQLQLEHVFILLQNIHVLALPLRDKLLKELLVGENNRVHRGRLRRRDLHLLWLLFRLFELWGARNGVVRVLGLRLRFHVIIFYAWRLIR
jgi:hypothetical protein